MQKMITVVLADEDRQYRQALKIELEAGGNIVVLGGVADGETLVSTVRKLRPDVVISEYVLPVLDGLSAMRALHSTNFSARPLYCILSGFSSELAMNEAKVAGADTFLCKPANGAALAEKITDLVAKKQEMIGGQHHEKSAELQLEILVTDCLNGIGVPINVKGYHYLRDGIMMTVKDAELENAVTKLLYPAIAKKNKATDARVERAIRHAIEVTYGKGDPVELQKYFGTATFGLKGRPTNSAFIATVANRLRLQIRIG